MAAKPGDLGWAYLIATFLAIAALESIPRFLFEIGQPIPIVQRIILLGLFLIVAWFFTVSVHEEFQWSILSGLFFLEMATGVAMAIVLFAQLYTPYAVYVGLFVLALRALAFSYAVSHKLTHMRTLVFCTCGFLLIIGEVIIIVSGRGI